MRHLITIASCCIATVCFGNLTALLPEIQAAAQKHGAWEPWSENGRIAHEHLLKKRDLGQIDVYFIGDSITRRWGALDYPEFLAFWKEAFNGWNAANFAWGGDSTHHMLWRLENGELEGLRPKVFSILAGTNNIGKGEKPGRAKDASEGLTALVETCRKYAPDATIIITAIFPRNDSDKSNQFITQANHEIAKLADGKKVRILNINEYLADDHGQFHKGISVDNIHLSLLGYKIWAEHLCPILEEILGPRAEVDKSPPPSGDPKKFPVYP